MFTDLCAVNTKKKINWSLSCLTEFVLLALPEVQRGLKTSHGQWGGCVCGYRTPHPSQHGTLDTRGQLFKFGRSSRQFENMHFVLRGTGGRHSANPTANQPGLHRRRQRWALVDSSVLDWHRENAQSVSLLLSLMWDWFCQTGFEGVHHCLPHVIFHVLFT